MKRTFLTLLATTLVGILIMDGPACAAPDKVITLRYAEGTSQNSHEARDTIIPWVKSVEKATNGRIKIDVYWDNTLCKPMDAWEAAKSGVADISFAMMGFWPGMTPLADVFSLPVLAFDSSEQASIIAWKLLEQYPSLRDQFKPLKVLAIAPSSAYEFLTTKKQIKTMEDVKGLKLRIAGGPPTEYIKSIGGVPMVVGMGDVYTNLQKGVMDGMAVAVGTIPAFRLYEVTKYLTHIPLFHLYATRVMNPKTWDNLPKDLQDAIMSVSGLKASQNWGKYSFDEGGLNARNVWKKAGHELIEHTPPAEELARWKEAARPFTQKWVRDMRAAGYTDAQSILDTSQNMIKTTKP